MKDVLVICAADLSKITPYHCGEYLNCNDCGRKIWLGYRLKEKVEGFYPREKINYKCVECGAES